MDDLLPLFIFIVIVIVNVLRAVAEKKGRKPPSDADITKPATPRKGPSTLEDFFEEIAKKFEPQPRDLPEWPEAIERPDYVHEMEEYERAQKMPAEMEQPAKIIPMPTPKRKPKPEPKPMPAVQAMPKPETPKLRTPVQSAMFKMPVQGAVFSGMSGMRISTPPLLRSATGHTAFELKNREQLKQALIASMVFGSPRAYDVSFDNTMAK